LIGVTAPAVNQLTEAGLALIYSAVGSQAFSTILFESTFKHDIYALNSSYVKSANKFKPTWLVASGSALNL